MNDELPAKPSSVPLQTQEEQKDYDKLFYVKWITVPDGKIPILLQSENGPCPILAIANALSLKGVIHLPLLEHETYIYSSVIMQILLDCMHTFISQKETSKWQQDCEAYASILELLPKALAGLDVNVIFDRPNHFEYTPELDLFDAADVNLYHAWIIPVVDDVSLRLSSKSYNALVETLVASDGNYSIEQEYIRNFFENTPSQISAFGVLQLMERMTENEYAVLFRNNHFCTVTRRSDEIYQLVTDYGYAENSDWVWQNLTIDGSAQFFNGFFSSALFIDDPNYGLDTSEVYIPPEIPEFNQPATHSQNVAVETKSCNIF